MPAMFHALLPAADTHHVSRAPPDASLWDSGDPPISKREKKSYILSLQSPMTLKPVLEKVQLGLQKRSMASGVAVSDGVIKVFNDMKRRWKCKKAVLFCLSEDQKNFILEDGKEILTSPYATFVKMLPDKGCCYSLYDATYETKESKRRTWCLSSGPLSLHPLRAK
ncbi:hypothetical protein QTO34_013722 [Cnephaeus nilssonii]|uniref:ADF-H domain-containing protein n=1 Tax=Cnephaeus nilssonii TaxID=3371016 RepID=A0AA40I8H8_CNENI|nr:hypothetical protein QTO34_013722 [Eptesicus nilssonii]